MSAHLDHDGLADVLADEPADGALAHLEECPACAASLADLQSSLAAVGTALAALPDPVLPDGLAARLDSAIARERRALSAGTATDVVPLQARQSRRPRALLPMAGGLAAAAVLVVGGILLTRGGSDHSSSTAAGVAARGATAGIATSSSGRDYAKGGAGLAAQLPSLLAGSAAPSAGLTDSSKRLSSLSPKAGTAPADPLAALRTTAGLAPCLASLTDPSDPGVPLALDYASYAGTPALVVVLPSPLKDKVYVYFVGAGCNAQDSKVLFFDKLTKP